MNACFSWNLFYSGKFRQAVFGRMWEKQVSRRGTCFLCSSVRPAARYETASVMSFENRGRWDISAHLSIIIIMILDTLLSTKGVTTITSLVLFDFDSGFYMKPLTLALQKILMPWCMNGAHWWLWICRQISLERFRFRRDFRYADIFVQFW